MAIESDEPATQVHKADVLATGQDNLFNLNTKLLYMYNMFVSII